MSNKPKNREIERKWLFDPTRIPYSTPIKEYVYCIKNETPMCFYETVCDIDDCDDSRPYKERPMYETRPPISK